MKKNSLHPKMTHFIFLNLYFNVSIQDETINQIVLLLSLLLYNIFHGLISVIILEKNIKLPDKTYYSWAVYTQFFKLFTYHIIWVYYIILTTLSTLNVFITHKMIHPELNLIPVGCVYVKRGKQSFALLSMVFILSYMQTKCLFSGGG